MAEASRKFNWQPILIGAVVIIALVLTGLLIKSLIGGKSGENHKPPKISLIPTTPPPPPPPPKEEKKIEPPKDQKVEQVVEQKVEQPPDNPALKMEGAAGDGPSAFAAGKVTSDDLSKLGNGGGLLNPFNTYAQTIKGELQRQLARRSELKRRQYRIEVRVWVDDGGKMKRYELLGTTNDSDTDDAIKSVLAALPTFSEAPPPKMPQPIRLRIVAAGRV